MISVTDLLLLSVYVLTFVVAAYISVNRVKYFIDRCRKGNISVFVLGAIIFVNAYSLSMIAAFSTRLRSAIGLVDHAGSIVTTYLWTVSQIGCLLGITLVLINVVTNYYDLAIVLGKRRYVNGNASGTAAQVIGSDSVAESSGEVRNGETDRTVL